MALAAIAPAKTRDEAAPPPTTGSDDDAPSWPLSESDEAAFLSEARDRGETVVAAPVAQRETEEAAIDPKALPSADQLAAKLSPEVREVLDDLFRAKFTNVRKVSPKLLK